MFAKTSAKNINQRTFYSVYSVVRGPQSWPCSMATINPLFPRNKSERTKLCKHNPVLNRHKRQPRLPFWLSASRLRARVSHSWWHISTATATKVKCYGTEEYALETDEPITSDASHLQDHFEALIPYGYEIDCGGFGDVTLNVKARRITVERNDRFEDYTTTTYEV